MDLTILTDFVLFAADEGGPDSPILVAILRWWPMIAIGFLFYFLLIRPQRLERDRVQAELAALKKNDRVLVAGGIYGVVTNVRLEDNEVIVKVDETTNTKLKVTFSSIKVLHDDSSKDKSK